MVSFTSQSVIVVPPRQIHATCVCSITMSGRRNVLTLRIPSVLFAMRSALGCYCIFRGAQSAAVSDVCSAAPRFAGAPKLQADERWQKTNFLMGVMLTRRSESYKPIFLPTACRLTTVRRDLPIAFLRVFCKSKERSTLMHVFVCRM